MKVFDVLIYEGYGYLCVSDDENSCSYVEISENRLKDFSRITGTSPMAEDFLRQLDYNPLSKEALNKSLHALAGSFPVMLCQMTLDVAMLRLRALFLA